MPGTPGHFALVLEMKFTVKLCSLCCHAEISARLLVNEKDFFWRLAGGVCGDDVQLHALGKHFRPVRQKNSESSGPARMCSPLSPVWMFQSMMVANVIVHVYEAE